MLQKGDVLSPCHALPLYPCTRNLSLLLSGLAFPACYRQLLEGKHTVVTNIVLRGPPPCQPLCSVPRSNVRTVPI